MAPVAARAIPRFAVPSDEFASRTEAINALLAPYTLVCGTGSWLEAHLVCRLGHVHGIPNLIGCGVTADEVLELCQRATAPVLVVLSTSIASDHGLALCRKLKSLPNTPSICCLIDQPTPGILAVGLPCDALINTESFGSGLVHDALTAISHGQSYQDPSLRVDKPVGHDWPIELKPREQQVLELLALGMTNKEIGLNLNIAAVTVRDYVQKLCQMFQALNRTDLVFKASSLGFLAQLPDMR